MTRTSSQDISVKKPRVALIHPAVGATLGGSQIFALELAQHLQAQCDVTIFSNKKVNELCQPVFSMTRGKLSKDKNFAIESFLKFVRKFVTNPDILSEHLSSFFPVFLKLLRGNYDVIYPNNGWGGLLVATAYRKFTKKPVIFTEHNGMLCGGKIARRNLKFKPDKYIVLSEDVYTWVKINYPDCNVEFIPNGVDLTKFSKDVPSAVTGLPHPIILVVGRNQANKRLHLAIEAVAQMETGSLLMLSSEAGTEEVRALGEELLGTERFRMMNVPYEQMPAYYNECDVFTLPSLQEPFGLVYIEAMACNKPVVAPKDPSREFIVGEGGILCDVTNINEYKQAIETALATNFGDKPREQAQKFSWKFCAERYYKAIESIL